jgi:hypothetical protein
LQVAVDFADLPHGRDVELEAPSSHSLHHHYGLNRRSCRQQILQRDSRPIPRMFGVDQLISPHRTITELPLLAELGLTRMPSPTYQQFHRRRPDRKRRFKDERQWLP